MNQVSDTFANSSFVAKSVKRVLGNYLNPVVVGCGVDPSEFAKPVDCKLARKHLGIGAENVLLTFCRLVARKGVDMVIKALPEVIHTVPNMVYIVAGDGPELPRLQELAKELGCDDHVRFEGRFSEEELVHYCSAADVFIMTSRITPDFSVEGFGITFLEAGLYELPVIGGRSGGIPDAVQDGVTGLLIDPENPREIAQAIIRLIKDPSLRRKLGQAVNEHIYEQMT